MMINAFSKLLVVFGKIGKPKKEGLTVAGLLLFGTVEAIRELRARHLIDYRLILDENDDESR